MEKKFMKRKNCFSLFVFLFISSLIVSCAIPVWQAYKVEDSLKVGNIQGDFFVGSVSPSK